VEKVAARADVIVMIALMMMDLTTTAVVEKDQVKDRVVTAVVVA
jgi:hypothetical protein